MDVFITGGTGFLGRYFINELLAKGHRVIALSRTPPQNKTAKEGSPQAASRPQLSWIQGDLKDPETASRFLVPQTKQACAVIHAGLARDNEHFMAHPANPLDYYQANVMGTLRLLEQAMRIGVDRFIFISSGAVHDQVLGDRPLDETHPLWPRTLYGASKAAAETMVHAYGLSNRLTACSLRPTAIYGLADPIADTKWFHLISDVVANRDIEVNGGSKEVHASDVAKAISLLLQAAPDQIAGKTFNCSDRMISHFEVAQIAKEISGSSSLIQGERKVAKHKISTAKIQSLGMAFGDTDLLRETIKKIVQIIKERAVF